MLIQPAHLGLGRRKEGDEERMNEADENKCDLRRKEQLYVTQSITIMNSQMTGVRKADDLFTVEALDHCLWGIQRQNMYWIYTSSVEL